MKQNDNTGAFVRIQANSANKAYSIDEHGLDCVDEKANCITRSNNSNLRSVEIEAIKEGRHEGSKEDRKEGRKEGSKEARMDGWKEGGVQGVSHNVLEDGHDDI